MPGDLLRFLAGPTPYSPWWLVLGVVLLAAVITWWVGVFVWTMPPQQLRSIPLVRSLHARLIRRRFAGSVRAVRDEYAAGHLPAPDAAAGMKRALRNFLALRTGRGAYYVQVGDMAKTDLAPAVPVMSALDDVQFSTASDVDLTAVGHDAEAVIRSWS